MFVIHLLSYRNISSSSYLFYNSLANSRPFRKRGHGNTGSTFDHVYSGAVRRHAERHSGPCGKV